MEKQCSCKKTIRSEEEKRAIRNKINRISGQLNGIQKMVDDDRYCDDILIQLSAVNHAVKSLANHIIEKHMYSCVLREINAGNEEILSEVANLFKRLQ